MDVSKVVESLQSIDYLHDPAINLTGAHRDVLRSIFVDNSSEFNASILQYDLKLGSINLPIE